MALISCHKNTTASHYVHRVVIVLSSAVLWLKHCRSGVKLYSIKQSCYHNNITAQLLHKVNFKNIPLLCTETCFDIIIAWRWLAWIFQTVMDMINLDICSFVVFGSVCCLSLSWSGSSRENQRLHGEECLSAGSHLFNLHHGAPSF